MGAVTLRTTAQGCKWLSQRELSYPKTDLISVSVSYLVSARYVCNNSHSSHLSHQDDQFDVHDVFYCLTRMSVN